MSGQPGPARSQEARERNACGDCLRADRERQAPSHSADTCGGPAAGSPAEAGTGLQKPGPRETQTPPGKSQGTGVGTPGPASPLAQPVVSERGPGRGSLQGSTGRGWGLRLQEPAGRVRNTAPTCRQRSERRLARAAQGNIHICGETSLTGTSTCIHPPQPRTPTALCLGESLSMVRDTWAHGILSQQALQASSRATRIGNYQNVP